MAVLVYANNAKTTLQSGISASQTTAVLATGSGAMFPALSGGEAFFLTFLDAETELTNEIVLVIARSGDSISMIRGADGTTARVWSAGDIAAQLVTAADMAQALQSDQLQSGTYTTSIAGGTGNSITAEITSSLSTIPNLLFFICQAAAANTGPATLTLSFNFNGNTITFPAAPILKGAGSALNAGDIPGADFPMELCYSTALGGFILLNPSTGVAGSVAGGAANELLKQTAGGTTGFVAAPTVAGSVLAFIGGVIQWAAAAVTSFNGRSGAVEPESGDYTADMVQAVPVTAFEAPNTQAGNPMFDVLPSGNIRQEGSQSITPNSTTTITFPKAFPNQCASFTASCNNQSSAMEVEIIDRFHGTIRVNATFISWAAAGN